jgi:membrane protein involved in colicin uptake
MIPNLGLPISPLGLLIKTDAQIKAEAEAKAKVEAEAKAKAVLDSVQQKIKDMQKATTTTVVTRASGTIGDQLGTSTSTSSTGGFVGGGTNVSSGSTITRAGAPKPIGGVVPFDGTIETLGRKVNFR